MLEMQQPATVILKYSFSTVELKEAEESFTLILSLTLHLT